MWLKNELIPYNTVTIYVCDIVLDMYFSAFFCIFLVIIEVLNYKSLFYFKQYLFSLYIILNYTETFLQKLQWPQTFLLWWIWIYIFIVMLTSSTISFSNNFSLNFSLFYHNFCWVLCVSYGLLTNISFSLIKVIELYLAT